MKKLLILFLFQVIFCQLKAQIKSVEIIDRKINYQQVNDSVEKVFYSKPAYLIVSAFEDNIAKTLSKSEVSIFIDGIKLQLIDTSKYLIIPKIDTSKTFKMIINHNGTEYFLNDLSVKKIINGAEVIVGCVTNFNELVSVAKENGMDQNSKDYELFNSRFYFTDKYTIDIRNYKEIAKMKFWIINPRQYGDGTYMSKVEIVKMKK